MGMLARILLSFISGVATGLVFAFIVFLATALFIGSCSGEECLESAVGVFLLSFLGFAIGTTVSTSLFFLLVFTNKRNDALKTHH